MAHWLFETENFKAARLWRALTAKEADQIRAQGIRAPVVVAPNGIRLEFFDKVDGSSTNRNRRRILFLGRLHPKKGIDLLIQAWSRLRASNPDWELVVAGPDEGGYLESLKATVRRLHLEESVTFPGTITGTEKVRLLKSADLFALTSHSEGFSVAILEAMACGLPILFTTPCNFPELATEGGGFQCEPEPESVRRGLAEALGAVKNEGQERGACARRLVEHGYTWPAISKRIVEACEHYCQ